MICLEICLLSHMSWWGGQQQTVSGIPSCVLFNRRIGLLNIQGDIFFWIFKILKTELFFFFVFVGFFFVLSLRCSRKFFFPKNTCGKEQWDLHSKASVCIIWHTLVNVSSEMLLESIKIYQLKMYETTSQAVTGRLSDNHQGFGYWGFKSQWD